MNDTDATTIQWLNLLHGSPSFVIRIDPRTSTPTVVQVEVVPDDDGVYWIAGTTTLPRGDVLPSVFQVDTAAGGSLLGVHWKIHGRWMSSSDRTQVLAALDAGEGDMFPFNWTYVVPLARNVYLDGTGASEGTA
ncbi:hypothetical protein SAMN05421803_12914 [Nocardiopsis flavescens]|uniref:Uncharacterized protein n=1 Tax=Nocardiopsis flavescens TaxID=758803 RepID=A0A1M6UPD5_9ACTN|nr:hypothetical protein [Nocardiopsis flavescens]SHK71077.1 hypothetical protein SAMN05421803_12914 [Nocardiopsis flavescens]